MKCIVNPTIIKMSIKMNTRRSYLYIVIILHISLFYFWLSYMLKNQYQSSVYWWFEMILWGIFGFFRIDFEIRNKFRFINIRNILLFYATLLIIIRVDYRTHIFTSLMWINSSLFRSYYNIYFLKGPIFRFMRSLDHYELNKGLEDNSYRIKGFNDDLKILSKIIKKIKNQNNLVFYCPSLSKYSKGGIFRKYINYCELNNIENWFQYNSDEKIKHISSIAMKVNDEMLIDLLYDFWLGQSLCNFYISGAEFEQIIDIIKKDNFERHIIKLKKEASIIKDINLNEFKLISNHINETYLKEVIASL